MRWVDGEARIGRDRGEQLHPRTEVATVSALNRMERVTSDVVSDWADFFTDRQAISDAAATYAPGEFTESDVGRIYDWCSYMYSMLGIFIFSH